MPCAGGGRWPVSTAAVSCSRARQIRFRAAMSSCIWWGLDSSSWFPLVVLGTDRLIGSTGMLLLLSCCPREKTSLGSKECGLRKLRSSAILKFTQCCEITSRAEICAMERRSVRWSGDLCATEGWTRSERIWRPVGILFLARYTHTLGKWGKGACGGRGKGTCGGRVCAGGRRCARDGGKSGREGDSPPCSALVQFQAQGRTLLCFGPLSSSLFLANPPSSQICQTQILISIFAT